MTLSLSQLLEQENLVIDFTIGTGILFIYDVLLTFDQEVDRIWRRKFNTASAIFLLIRSSNIMIPIAAILSNFGPQGRASCEAFNVLWNSFAILSDIGTSAFITIRMWAIWGQSSLVLIVFALATVVYPSFQLFEAIDIRFVSFSTFPLPYGGCQWASLVSIKAGDSFGTVTRVWFVLSSAMALAGTVFKTIGIKRDARIAGIETRLVDLLLRDGTIYFLATFCLNILSVALDYALSPGNNPIGVVANVIGSILISRLILNLRKLDQAGQQGSNLRSFSQVRFASALAGNMGAPLSYDLDGETEAPILQVSADQAKKNPLAAGILYGLEVEPPNESATHNIPEEMEATGTDIESAPAGSEQLHEALEDSPPDEV